jgi:hypothetical protein
LFSLAAAQQQGKHKQKARPSLAPQPSEDDVDDDDDGKGDPLPKKKLCCSERKSLLFIDTMWPVWDADQAIKHSNQ